MKFLPSAAAVLALSAVGVAGAQETYELTRTPITSADDPLVHRSMQTEYSYEERLGEVKVMPAEISGKAYHFRLQVADGPLVVVADAGETWRLYVDSDRDGDLSDEEPRQPVRERRDRPFLVREFGVFQVNAGEGDEAAQVEVRIDAYTYRADWSYLYVYPAVACAGSVELEGSTRKVAVVDADLNGRYDDVFAPVSGASHDYDVLAVDLTGDRAFRPGSGETAEVLPLPRLIRFGGSYYSVEVARDGLSLSLEPTEPEFGELQTGTPDAGLTLASDSGFHELKPGVGKWRLPAGQYAAWDLKLQRKEADGSTWALEGAGGRGELEGFELRGDETTTIEMGAPLTVKALIERQGRGFQLGVEISGRAGEDYIPGADRNGRRVPPPTFRVVNEAGRPIAAGAFEYG